MNLVACFNEFEKILRFPSPLLARKGIIARKEIAVNRKEITVKKYIVTLSGGERQQLEKLIRKGNGPAWWLLKSHILLKADVSEAGEGWSDSRIMPP